MSKKGTKSYNVLKTRTFDMERESLESLKNLLFDSKWKRLRSIGEFVDTSKDRVIYWLSGGDWRRVLSKTVKITKADENAMLRVNSGALLYRELANEMLDCISGLCYDDSELESFRMEHRLKRNNIRKDVLKAVPVIMTRPFEFVPWSFCRHSIYDMCLSCSSNMVEMGKTASESDSVVHRVSIRRIGPKRF